MLIHRHTWSAWTSEAIEYTPDGDITIYALVRICLECKLQENA
jgi:hypothetical protein